MSFFSNLLLFILLLSLIACADDPISYNNDIRPILTTKCLSCHGGVKKNGGFSLLFESDALGLTASGAHAIIPGDPSNSELIKRISNPDPKLRMPYEKPPLSENEIALLKKWIKQGAKFEKHWSFIPPNNSIFPPEIRSDWFSNDIDKFILSKMEENELSPNPEANPAILLRRVSLDLVGISSSEEKQFLEKPDQNEYGKIVDELLSSPQFGEKWASMWLDLSRYADTQGYEKDPHRSIWSYRDYIIKSLNQDKPYNQFILEQMAGDMQPNPTSESIIATAFHRNTMTNTEGGTDDEEFRVSAIIDRVNTTYEAFQGLTMACVQCHTHPFDPIVHEDYYKSYAILNNTKDKDLPNDYPVFTHFSETEKDTILKIIQTFGKDEILKDQKVNLNSTINTITFPILATGNAETISGASIFNNNTVGNFQKEAILEFGEFEFSGETDFTILFAFDDRISVQLLIDGEQYNSLVLVGNGTDKTIEHSSKLKHSLAGKHNISLKISLEEPWPWWKSGNISQLKFSGGSNTNPINSDFSKALLSRKKTSLPVLSELSDSLKRTSYIFEKGNWTAHGKEVIPGIPEIFNQDGKSFENRLEMGKWLASNKNPLTARVIVNRIWEQLFGAGIVATTSDFGAMGTPPTHPLLLDWLSIKFMNEWNWSLKKLIREIVLSSTYKQSSVISSEKREKDPSNKWLSRGARFRLSAEQTRDQLLAISGLLSNKMYGPSVMPPQPDNVWSIVYSGADWTESKGEDRYRRAIYTYWRRTSPYPSMSSFDSPSREYCVSQRIRTNTPLQALVMLNDTVSIEAAQHLASNAIHSTQDNSTRAIINNMYTKAIGISPDSNVLNTLEKLYEEALEEFGRSAEQVNDFVFINTKLNKDLPEFAALSVTANAILNLDAFIMKY